jgi:SPP1 Gp6-like portal protein
VALSNVGEVADLVIKQLLPAWRNERQRLDRIDRWYRWDHDDIKLPRRASSELKALVEMSKVPWLGLVVTTTAQAMYVDGFRSESDPEPDRDDEGNIIEPPLAGPWRLWKLNDLDNKQIAIHRAALAYGYSFTKILPGTDFMGKPMPVIRGVSPRRMWAAYEDAAEDQFPQYAMEVYGKLTDTERIVKVYDDTYVWHLKIRSEETVSQAGGEQPYEELTPAKRHGVGFCPIVRYTNQMDLEGRTPGEVEPHIPLAARINKTAYDRLLTQHFNSWKVRTIAGLAAPDPDELADVAEQVALERQKLRLRQDDLLVAEDPDTKFGTLEETQLGGFIDAWRADLESLSAVSQTPTHELTGQLVNVSAEGLAMIRAAQMQKIGERKITYGSGHVLTLKVASAIDGDKKHATDPSARVTWQDTSIRSMAQAVDALGKLATMLRVPVTELWGRVPGVEKTDVAEWKKVAREDDPINRMQDELTRQSEPGARGSADEGLS